MSKRMTMISLIRVDADGMLYPPGSPPLPCNVKVDVPAVELVTRPADAVGDYLVFVPDHQFLDPVQLIEQRSFLDAHASVSFQNWLGKSDEIGLPDARQYLAAEKLMVLLMERGVMPPSSVMIRCSLAGASEGYVADTTDELKLKLSAIIAYPMSGPDYIQIGPTDACNSHCLFCVHHSPLIDHTDQGPTTRLNWNIWRNCLDDLICLKTKRVDYIGIGEPLLHPQIDDALRYGSSSLTQNLYSNGLLLHRHLNVVADHVDWLTVSLNAVTSKTHQTLHLAGEDAFETIVGSIRKLMERKDRRVQISLSFVVNKLNFREIEDLPALCKELGVSAGLTPVGVYNDTKEHLALTPEDQLELKDLLDRVSRQPDHRISNLDTFRQFENRDTSFIVRQIPCYVGLFFAQIRGDGSVVHCCACDHGSVGNINETNFPAIWTSLAHRQFRRDALCKIIETQCALPGCHCDICGFAHESIKIHNRLYGTDYTSASLKRSASSL